MTHVAGIDYAVMGLYSAFVLGIGVLLRRSVRTSEDFFLSGRAIPAWVTGLAFLSANLGAQEVIGMGASGAKYGIATSHFYWIGAIPAMVFIGLFMMPFYYGSRARSVREYLTLRFDETRCGRTHAQLGDHGSRRPHAGGRGVARAGDGARLRALVRLLVHRFPGGPARHGREFDDRRAAHDAHRRTSQDAVPVSRDFPRDD